MVNKRFHNEKIPNVNTRLRLLFLFAARHTPCAITWFLQSGLPKPRGGKIKPHRSFEPQQLNFTYCLFMRATKSRNYTYLRFLIRR